MSADRTVERNELTDQGLTYESAERLIEDRDHADWVSRGMPEYGNDHATPERGIGVESRLEFVEIAADFSSEFKAQRHR